MGYGLFESLPVAGVYVLVTLLILGSCEVGYHLGHHARSRQDKVASESLGPMVGGLLGMLAFVLAFTFSMAATQNDKRKQGVLDEANAIGTAYLRTELLPAEEGAVLRQQLSEYVNERLRAVDQSNLASALARSVELHAQMWAQVAAAARKDANTNTALMAEALNQVIDMHENRVSAALYNRIPGSVWIALFAICGLAMLTLGTQIGLSGKRRLVAVLPLSLAFAVLVTLVVDIDRPQSGLIKVGQSSMLDLQQSMQDAAK
jgi:hypothetical protein